MYIKVHTWTDMSVILCHRHKLVFYTVAFWKYIFKTKGC